jgi:peptide/nickel transport system substrate-binding protein
MALPFRLWMAMLGALVLAPLPARAESPGPPRYGGVLRAGMQTDPIGLDPHTTNSTATRNLLENVYDTLVAFSPTGQLVPSLAAAWSVAPDGRTYTFHLRPGVRFHDGAPLLAEDVVFSLLRLKDPRVASPRSEDFAAITTVRAPDSQTVVVQLRTPLAPLLSKLAFSMNAIVPAHVVRAGGDLQRIAVGTGPFRLVDYQPQARLLLTRFPGYWGRDAAGRPLPYLDGIEFRFFPDANARTLALRTGYVDFIEYVPAADVALLRRDPALRVTGGVSTNFRSLVLNTKVPPLDDPRVRQALAYAIDTQAIVDMALLGVGGVAAHGASVPPVSPFALPDSPYQKRDLARARALLAQAGLPQGFAITLLCTSTYDFLRTPAEVIAANLKDIGVRVRLRVLDWSLFLPQVVERRFALALWGESGLADPDDFLYEPLHSRGGQNVGSFADAELDRLLEAGRQALEPGERTRLYTAAQRRVLFTAPHVFLFHSAQHEAMRDWVHGFAHYFNTSYLGLRSTWLARPEGAR